jgi:6,7-dimethyl-8-ribityllumazine synthase
VSGEGRPGDSVVDAAGLRLGIVCTRWNGQVVGMMLERALLAAEKCGVTDPTVVQVAGALELPVAAQELARQCDAVVALGAVIRGGTPHFEHVCRAAVDGLARVTLDERTPVGNGVLTCDTLEQAMQRSGAAGSTEDKGYEATLAALDAALVLNGLRHRPGRPPL